VLAAASPRRTQEEQKKATPVKAAMTTVRGRPIPEVRTRKVGASSTQPIGAGETAGRDRESFLPVKAADDDPARDPYSCARRDGRQHGCVDRGPDLRNPQAQRQFGKAAWALTQDTSLARQMPGGVPEGAARCIAVRAPAHTPHTDAEIAVKLRKNQIAKTLTSESPFVQHMDAEQRTIYLNKGIAW